MWRPRGRDDGREAPARRVGLVFVEHAARDRHDDEEEPEQHEQHDRLRARRRIGHRQGGEDHDLECHARASRRRTVGREPAS